MPTTNHSLYLVETCWCDSGWWWCQYHADRAIPSNTWSSRLTRILVLSSSSLFIFVLLCSFVFFLVLLCSSLLGDDHDGDETMMEGSGSLNPLANLFIFQHRSMAKCVINLFHHWWDIFGGKFLSDIFGEEFSVGKVRGESLVRYFRWEFFWGNFQRKKFGVNLWWDIFYGKVMVGKVWREMRRKKGWKTYSKVGTQQDSLSCKPTLSQN